MLCFPPQVIDRLTNTLFEEQVSGKNILELLYGNSWCSRSVGQWLATLVSRWPACSAAYGWTQRLACSRSRIRPFIEKYGIDPEEFLEDIDSFSSFDAFFTRKLKPSARPILSNATSAVIPADGRYWFYQDVSKTQGFIIKGKTFDIETLLNKKSLEPKYHHGSMVLARLCPTDYHRFHFPVDCVPSQAQRIDGYLYSVNPLAIKKNLSIFTSNRRVVTYLESPSFGTVACVEIGATNVGSIQQTYKPHHFYKKGNEKGYFSLGASALALLFEPGRLVFDPDLVQATQSGYEIRCLMGQSMGSTDFPYS